MNTTLPLSLLKPILVSSLAFIITSSADAQSYKGKDGNGNYNLAGTYIVNRYATLASSVNAGSFSVTVTSIADLKGSNIFALNVMNPYASDALTTGDLVMIMQMQGADITTTDDANYGAITNYNNTGNYEIRTVYSVTNNTILLCQNLNNSYTQSGRSRTQVIRMPRYAQLTIASGVTLTGMTWNGANGGVVAIESNGNATINGSISANAIGFRGGVDDKSVSSASGSAAVVLYRSTANLTATKGEGIAGSATDYQTYLNGSNGRGAPANGGGGGNGHNSGGGGGSNGATSGSLGTWNGTGIKSVSTANWANAWNLESASFATNVSTGGGRGGYSYANSNQDALTIAPGNTAWGGDYRNNVGGLGGRPLDYNNNTRLFMGGGGGAGEGNNNCAGNGGAGGGIVFLFSNGNISGTGNITAKGQDGYDTQLTNIDAAGGAGGGGAIVALAKGSLTSISLNANGGNGGNQLYLAGEAEGPGGGGGGGYIATTTTSITRTVAGGTNGTSASALVTEFLPNGATIGNNGTIASTSFVDVYACNPQGFILPIQFESFTATTQNTLVKLNWIVGGDKANGNFEIERSIDGQSFTKVGQVRINDKSAYDFVDNLPGGSSSFYYRIKWMDSDRKYYYSEVRVVKLAQAITKGSMGVYPNPAVASLQVTMPETWIGKTIRFELFDISGRLAHTIEKSQANRTESININNLQQGMYIVKASMGTESAQQRFIKN